MTSEKAGRHAANGAAAIVCVMTCGVVAGCSSGPSPSQLAQSSRAPVLSAAKGIYRDVYDAHIGWSALITGGIELCGTDAPATGKGPDELQYSASQEMLPFGRRITLSDFGQQVIRTLDGKGWRLRPAPAPNPAHPVPTYAGRRDGLTLQLLEFQDSAFGPTVTIGVGASCFKAGSAAQQILSKGVNEDQINELRPSSAPLRGVTR